MRTLAAWHLSAKAALRWTVSAVVHSHQGYVEERPDRAGVHAGVTRVVGNVEKTVCGECVWLLFLCLGKQNVINIILILMLMQERDTYKYTYLRKVMLSLLESRRELLGATLTQDQTLELQMKVISKIDWGNR